LKQRCVFQEYGLAEYREAINAPGDPADKRLTLDYGPRWENVKKIHMGEGEVLISLELAEEFAGDLENYLLHPALLDKATSLAAFQLCADSDFLPFSYKTLKLYAPLQRKIYSYGRAKANGRSDEVLTFDITILDEHGKRLAEIENFTIRKLSGRALEALGSQNQENEHAQTPSGFQKATADDLADAIRPNEGVEVFRRILGANCPSQLVVSARDLRHRMALVQTSGASKDKPQLETGMKPRHPRPALKTSYAAPENDLEQSIADIWQMVLGIEQVGRNDNFIELGGHSLLAIQVISRLREALQVDLAMDSIFKSPTVAALANQVVAMFAEQADSETLSAMLAEIEGMSAQ
jgi:acyl carrier protein